ncbi:hypothetical protein GOP47_0013358 [Adiantum capillus-veneris]|uniref:Uncharacterized protein n=1 Tax=Adiantum capillus-veneris TaxID=13818 RepID=A0A9D4ZEG5_ADICA|nr:hypothetical protein GOP47_0013358 [Adiantum capillus-veneris]
MGTSEQQGLSWPLMPSLYPHMCFDAWFFIWFMDYGLFLLESRLSKEEGVVQVFPLLVRGKAKTWYDVL